MSDQKDDQANDQSSTPVPDDFANFDPASYVHQRRVAEGRQRLDQSLDRTDRVETSRRRRGRGRRVADEDIEDALDDDDPEMEVGMGSRFFRPFSRGEGLFLWGDILREAGPMIGRFLPLIGCFLLVACVAVAGGLYVLYSALTRH